MGLAALICCLCALAAVRAFTVPLALSKPRGSVILSGERKFAQPLTSGGSSSGSSSFKQKQKPKPKSTTDSSRKKRAPTHDDDHPRRIGADGKIFEENNNRIRNAGRVGTKRFIDPCKVFIGNLPFSVDEEQLQKFVLDTTGQSGLVVHSVKVIREWRTGKSKGYGFCVFTDPIFATICMDVCNGVPLGGRPVSVSQGKKKEQDNLLYIKKKKKNQSMDDEEAAINEGLEMAGSDDDDDDEFIPTFGGQRKEDAELDAALFSIESDMDDDDDDDIDGIFLERPQIYGEVDPDLNREQRREAQRRMKRTKRPRTGFG